MRLRQPSARELLSRIRGLDLAPCDDEGLRQAVSRLRSLAADKTEGAEALLPECFAIVAEAIDRRLGAWRVFDHPPQVGGSADEARMVAGTVADVNLQLRHRRPGDIMLPAGFYGAVRRTDESGALRFRATEEQLTAGIHLFRGRVVQMDAGEGKTVAIAFAAVLHAVLGRRVHVVTANDYLAERDAGLLEPVYRSLGLDSGAVPGYMEEGERRHVYRRDIVYSAMRELGFDYLRDHLKTVPSQRVQQPLDVAIVDEADHALIDEVFTPLIISGNPMGSTRTAVRVDAAVAGMIDRQRGTARDTAAELDSANPGGRGVPSLLATLMLADPDSPDLSRHVAAHPSLARRARALAAEDHAILSEHLYYAVPPGSSVVTLTDRGREHLERRLGPLYDSPEANSVGPPGVDGRSSGRPAQPGPAPRPSLRRYRLANQVLQALRARVLLQRNVDYLVDGEDVVLIDPHTGRPKPDSIYQHGLQPAVEAREGVIVRPECETMAQVSVSGFMDGYRQVSGITGTAVPAAGEFRRKYGLQVALVPPASPPRRTNCPPVVYLSEEDKLGAVVDEAAARHRFGQPVLVGTRTVEQSEVLGRRLEERGVPHRVLNAVTTHTESRIVREAGALGAVTVATHMAGRGTDILLEPELDTRIALRCAAEIERLLMQDSENVGGVDVSCPSPELALFLEAMLQESGALEVKTSHVGCVLRVANAAGDSAGTGRAAMDFALGLCVIGTEVHDSSRVSLQLNGRSGRQGHFGLTRTFLSLEDRLVNLDAHSIIRLDRCRETDSAGRVCYTGSEVSRRIEALQGAADREGESRRALMQEYASEFDRQTILYHQRRQHMIDLAGDEGAVSDLLLLSAERVARRLADSYLGLEPGDYYSFRFKSMVVYLHQEFGLDCSGLYGTDLTRLPHELALLLTGRLDHQAARSVDAEFHELARLLWLEVCGDLWPGHIASLQDSVAVELLSFRSHKSAVAAYIRRCADAWDRFWEQVEEEFISRLATFPVSAANTGVPATAPVAASRETGLLLARRAQRPPGGA